MDDCSLWLPTPSNAEDCNVCEQCCKQRRELQATPRPASRIVMIATPSNAEVDVKKCDET
jgi:hypothetical protein